MPAPVRQTAAEVSRASAAYRAGRLLDERSKLTGTDGLGQRPRDSEGNRFA
jgi:hypothetical protein